MKKCILVTFLSVALSISLSSCFSHKFTIGEGPKTGEKVIAKNNFYLYGLIPGKVSNPQSLAGNSANFKVTEVRTFTDGLIATLTLGLYTPTTTKVQK